MQSWVILHGSSTNLFWSLNSLASTLKIKKEMQRCKSNFYIVESYLKYTVKVSFQKTRSQIILQLSFSFDEPGDFLLMWEHIVGGYKIVQIACTKQNLSSLIIIEVHKNLTPGKSIPINRQALSETDSSNVWDGNWMTARYNNKNWKLQH